MENEEKEDLLREVGESSDSDVSDCYIQGKILHVLEKDKHRHKSWTGNLLLIISCFVLFISSSVLLIIFPVYINVSSRCEISGYSKLFTLSSVFSVMFTILFALFRWLKNCVNYPAIAASHLSLCLPSVVKASFSLSIGSLLVFWLADQKLISCHLEDPLKGCVIVFSLLFYFIFSRRRTSVERVFCTITVIIGTFVTVDFGLCNRYRCRGKDLRDAVSHPLSWHAVYVVAYILALGAYALHLTCLENCCSSSKYSSILDMSIVSNVSHSGERSEETLPSSTTRSLSIISGEFSQFRPRIPLNVSLPRVDSSKFPMTSTPNDLELRRSARTGITSWLVTHHALVWLLVALGCWLPTVGFGSLKPRLLVDVVDEIVESFIFHLSCNSLWWSSVLLLSSYLVFAVSSAHVLVATRSALTVACVLMNALPMAQLFWSLFQLDNSAKDPVSFKFTVSGEAVSAMVGFPIIGIGTFLIVKSHVNQASRELGTI